MGGETKTRIAEVALQLFSQNGYLGTSMRDIAAQLGVTKPALYKHYASKHAILESIVKRMNDMDYVRAEEYDMPESKPDGFAEAYQKTPIERFAHTAWHNFDIGQRNPFPHNFAK